MATSTFTAWDDVTTAHFNQMGTALSAALAAMGLVKVSGPAWGAIVPGRSAAVEVWRFADTLQATQPVYIQIEYDVTGTGCGFFVTVSLDAGFATTGPRMLLGDNSSNTGSVVAQQNCYISGATNRLQLAMFNGPNVLSGMFLNVERTKDAAGADTAEGVIVQATLKAPTTNFNDTLVFDYVIPYGAVVFAGYNKALISAVNPSGISQDYQNVVGTSLIVPFNFRPYNPGMGAVLYMSSDFPLYTAQTISIYAANHVYLPLSGFTTLTLPSTPTSIAMRYE